MNSTASFNTYMIRSWSGTMLVALVKVLFTQAEEPKETDIFTKLLYVKPWTDKCSRRNADMPQGNGCS